MRSGSGSANTRGERTRLAADWMREFAARTGATGGGPPVRYLWTDAFAVCNALGLAGATADEGFEALALRLVDGVHHVLGRHRPDAARAGWISGLPEAEGEAHPTAGGLRIGKPLPERRADEPFDERLEWERDGQYFHYLTKWMHALDQVARATGNAGFNRWARELAARAHAGFSAARAGVPGLHWKMSVDLSRPLVPSMGQHDPLDGYLTCLQLRASAAALSDGGPPDLEAETARFRSMIGSHGLATADPLGIGALLADAFRLEQLERQGAAADGDLLADLLEAALAGLEVHAREPDLDLPAPQRLAFRELGLAIGLHAIEPMMEAAPRAPLRRERLERLARHADLRNRIERFWLDPANRRAASWSGHRDINEVMLATSLAPEGFLVLAPVRR